jgi:hypothetical protein
MNHKLQRGQALVETIIFVPLFLVALFAILYFGQVGVKQVRVQTAIRYGINTLPQSEFAIEQVYATFDTYSSVTYNVPLPGLTPVPCPSSAATQTQLAFNQAQSVPTSAPSAQPYWQMTAPTISCSVTFLPVANLPDMYNNAMPILEETANSITGTVTAATYLNTFLPSSYAITGLYNGYLPATIPDQIACTPFGGGGHGTKTGDGMAMALAMALNPGTDSQGRGAAPYYGGYDTGLLQSPNSLCNFG